MKRTKKAGLYGKDTDQQKKRLVSNAVKNKKNAYTVKNKLGPSRKEILRKKPVVPKRVVPKKPSTRTILNENIKLKKKIKIEQDKISAAKKRISEINRAKSRQKGVNNFKKSMKTTNLAKDSLQTDIDKLQYANYKGEPMGITPRSPLTPVNESNNESKPTL
tara:strand:- start:261 stop:746 length:486 start_codon:yes stop_codon:yes gene_type:complete